MAQLVDDAMVQVSATVRTTCGSRSTAASCRSPRPATILAESAEFESEIDADRAKADAASDDPQTAARGRSRLRALGQLD